MSIDERELVELVLRAQKGDGAALRELILSTKGDLQRFCIYLVGSPQLAEDLMQEAYSKALSSLGKLKDKERFKSWLIKIARNAYLDYTRRAKNKPWVELQDQKELVLENERERMDEILRIRKTLMKLPEDLRAALILTDMEGHTPAEAATILGISLSTCRGRIQRGRQVFLDKFEKN